MNAQGRASLRRDAHCACRRAAVAVLGVWCALTAVGRTQTVPSVDAPAEIEMYYGVKKWTPTKPAAKPSVAIMPTSPIVSTPLRALGIPAPTPTPLVSPPPAPLPELRPLPTLPPEPIPVISPSELPKEPIEQSRERAPEPEPERGIVHASHETSGVEHDRSHENVLEEPVPSFVPPPVQATMPAAQVVEVRPEPAHDAETSPRTTYITLSPLQMAALTGTIVVCMAAMLLVTIHSLRRFGMKNPFRVELVLPPGWTNPPNGAASTAGVAPSLPDSLPVPVEEPSTAQKFDLGPTYEEERLAREAEADARAEALLRLICEQNVKLQTELAGQATGDGTPAHEEPNPVAV